MSKRNDLDLLRDIKACMKKIVVYTRALDYEDFAGDYKTQDAVVRNLEIIGEAAKRISPGFRNKHKNIPWGKMSRQRDKLIHHYSGVDYDIVWGVVRQSLPELAPRIDDALKKGERSRQ